MPKKSAPTKVIAENRDTSIKFYAGLLGVTVLVMAGAVFLGRSDAGEIDVNAAIINANTENQVKRDAGEEASEEVNTIPKRLRDLPNGGLVPMENQSNPKPKPANEPVEDENGSTTEDGADESSEGESSDEETESEEESSDTEEDSTEEGASTDAEEETSQSDEETTEEVQS